MKHMTVRRLWTVGASALILAFLAVPSLAGPPAGGSGTGQGHGKMKSVIASLNLTPAQKARMRSIQKTNKPELKAIMTNTSLTPDQKRAQAKPIREAQRRQMMTVLTPAQKAEMRSELKGMRRGTGRPVQ